MDDTLVLCGRGVRLEPLSFDHVEDLVSAANESRETYSFTLVPSDRASMKAYVEAALADRDRGWAVPFATRELASGRLIGTTRFLDLEFWVPARPDPDAVEIGSTWLAASAQRTAINTEAKLIMLSYAFETWTVHRVTLKTDARNARSRQAIERIGGVYEGVRRAHMPATDGTIRDTAYYSILRAEWPAVKTSLRERLGYA